MSECSLLSYPAQHQSEVMESDAVAATVFELPEFFELSQGAERCFDLFDDVLGQEARDVGKGVAVAVNAAHRRHQGERVLRRQDASNHFLLP